MEKNKSCKGKELNGKECSGVLAEDTKKIKKYFPYLLKEGSPLLCPKCGNVHRKDGSLWRESFIGIPITRVPNVKFAKKEMTVKKAIEALRRLKWFLEENFKDVTISVFERNNSILCWHQNMLLFLPDTDTQPNWEKIHSYRDDHMRSIVKKFGLRKSHIEKRQRSLTI